MGERPFLRRASGEVRRAKRGPPGPGLPGLDLPPVQALEGRVLLSTYTVTGTADVASTAGNYVGTLRWAVAQANAANAPASGPRLRPQRHRLRPPALRPLAPDHHPDPGPARVDAGGDHDHRPRRRPAYRQRQPSQQRVPGGQAGHRQPLRPHPRRRRLRQRRRRVNNVGTLTLTDSVLSGDSAGSGFGGGIANGGTLTLTGSTLSGDSGSYGGGIYNKGTLTITGSTLSGNSGSYGGGVDNSGTLTVSDSTLSANTSGFGGGVWTSAPVTLNNTIAAANTAGAAGPDLYMLGSQASFSGSNNLVGNGTGETGLTNGQSGNQVGTTAAPINPQLGPLQNNGGPTETRALLAGSPAIDKGSNAAVPSGVTTDQRGPGFARVFNGTVDIGAFEVQPVAPRPTVVSVTPEDAAGHGAAAGSTGGQRSIVSQLVVSFSEPVHLAAGAFTLGLVNNFGSGANNGSADTNASAVLGTAINPGNDGLTRVVPIVQSGASTTYSYNLSGGGACLQDGVFRLSTAAAAVTASNGGAAMASAYTSSMFHRLYGDTDGNKTVNALDFAKFKAAFGTGTGASAYNADLDTDGNGTINALDYAQFKKRFGLTFAYT